MPLSAALFVLARGAVTPVNTGLMAIGAACAVGILLAGLSVAQAKALFHANPSFVLLGATLLFSTVCVTGTVDLLAAWTGRLARGKRRRIPVLMFALTAFLATAGAFTPAAVFDRPIQWRAAGTFPGKP